MDIAKLLGLKGKGLRKSRFIHWLLTLLNPRRMELMGGVFYLDPNDFVVSKLIFRRQYESFETEVLKKLVTRGMSAIDLGANIGYYSVIMSGLGAYVYAFEPNPRSFLFLMKNISGRSVEAYNLGISDHTGKGILYLNDYNSGDNRLFQKPGMKGVNISLTTLDEVIPREAKIDLMKIDIQGAEGLALKGARRILSENSDLILIFEFWPSAMENLKTPADEVLAMLVGFHLYEIQEDTQHIFETTEKELLTRYTCKNGKATNLIASRKELNYAALGLTAAN